MTALLTRAKFDRAAVRPLADALAVAVAVALPWSTCATAICIAAWLLAALATLDPGRLKQALVTPAGGLPVLLFGLGALGMLWAGADVDWHARLGGLGGFARLLIIPLLLAQFRASAYGFRVLYGFFVSAGLLLIASYALALVPGLTWRGNLYGVPVHDDIFQNAEFLVCGFAALGVGCARMRKRQWPTALALIAVAALFLGNIVFVFTSRIALLVMPVLALVLGWRALRLKGVLGALALAVLVGAAAWAASPPLRARIDNSLTELRAYRAANSDTSIGEHAAFLTGSLKIIAAAPLFGHGTGSIGAEFRRAAAGATGTAALAPDNPHNQTFAVAIQIGALGAAVLWAMWAAHLVLLRGSGLAAWCGTVVVVENIVSSLAHSHLFDFNNGWLYMVGVGVAGGMVLRARDLAAKPEPLP